MPNTYLENKINKPSYHYSDVLHNEHSAVFTIAKSTEADILNDVKSALIDALKNGKTLTQFKKELKPILVQKGWWGAKEAINPKTGKKELVQLGSPKRLETIYEANKRSTRAAVLWEEAQDTKEVLPYFLYKLGPSKEHREEHKNWNGLILPVDDPFWDYAFPPNGWGCKCYVSQISEEECKRRGGVSKRPSIKFDTKRLGNKNVNYMKGVDPSWSSNSGKFKNKVLSDMLEDKLLKSSPNMAVNQIKDIVNSTFFSSFIKKATKIQEKVKEVKSTTYNYVPVAYVEKGISNTPRILRLSEEDIANNKKLYKDLSLSDYALIQDIIKTGFYNKTKQAYLKQIGNFYYIVEVKFSNKDLLVNSFHKIEKSLFVKLKK